MSRNRWLVAAVIWMALLFLIGVLFSSKIEAIKSAKLLLTNAVLLQPEDRISSSSDEEMGTMPDMAAGQSAMVSGESVLINSVFPLKPSSDSSARYLVDQNGQPFFIGGEAAWSLIGQVSLEDAKLYLDDLAARGFNTVITTLVEGYYADNAPANYYNVAPYIPANDFSSPNDAYFAHADAVINYAASKGILVILSPNYLGCCNDGWRSVLENQNSIDDAVNFGTYVGNRYKGFPNLIYAWGNDMIPDNSNVRDKIDAMAQAVKSADPNHLHTFHASSEYSSWEIMSSYDYDWIDFNSVYTYNSVHGEVAYNYDPDNDPTTPPPLPLFLFESHYENDWAGMPAIVTRREGYVAVLSGASGYAYGNNPIWHMNGHPSWSTTDWHNHLNDEGRADMTNFQALFTSRDWVNLIPDQDDTLVIGNKGSGDNYAAAAVTADGGTAIIYFLDDKTITVDMDQISGSNANVWWFNPRNGNAQSAGTVATTGSHQFTPPTNDDWLLVLDNADLDLLPPGEQPPSELDGSITGTVILQGRTDYSSAQVCADNGGSSICTQSDDSGAYSIDVLEGNYTVTVTNKGYLAAEKLDVPVTAGGMTNLDPVTLLGGNTNDDCVVNILDLSLIGGRFRSGCSDTSWDARADINNDCSVDILDLSLTGGNFGKSCPVPWNY